MIQPLPQPTHEGSEQIVAEYRNHLKLYSQFLKFTNCSAYQQLKCSFKTIQSTFGKSWTWWLLNP